MSEQHADESRSVPDRLRVLMVCSAGGHLAQLLRLRSWYERHDVTWSCLDILDARNLLADQQVQWAYQPTTRNIPNLVRNTILALQEVHARRPQIIVSSGAAIAVPFFWIGKAFGAKTVYVEVIDRFDTRTVTARLVSPITDVMIVQDEQQVELFPGSYNIGRLL